MLNHRHIDAFVMRAHLAHALFVAFGQFGVDAADARVPGVDRRGSLFRRSSKEIAHIVNQGAAPAPPRPAPYESLTASYPQFIPIGEWV